MHLSETQLRLVYSHTSEGSTVARLYEPAHSQAKGKNRNKQKELGRGEGKGRGTKRKVAHGQIISIVSFWNKIATHIHNS